MATTSAVTAKWHGYLKFLPLTLRRWFESSWLKVLVKSYEEGFEVITTIKVIFKESTNRYREALLNMIDVMAIGVLGSCSDRRSCCDIGECIG